MALLLLSRGRPFFFVRESPAVYRPRRPERTAFYRHLEAHFGEFALVHEERFERKDGPLRSVVTRAVDAFLACGPPENGFARVTGAGTSCPAGCTTSRSSGS